MLTKTTIETALNAELDDHLGYDKHQDSPTENTRNGFSSKKPITEDGSFDVTRAAARADVFEFIEIFYNPRKRRELGKPIKLLLTECPGYWGGRLVTH